MLCLISDCVVKAAAWQLYVAAMRKRQLKTAAGPKLCNYFGPAGNHALLKLAYSLLILSDFLT
jgi:hypothetical protein